MRGGNGNGQQWQMGVVVVVVVMEMAVVVVDDAVIYNRLASRFTCLCFLSPHCPVLFLFFSTWSRCVWRRPLAVSSIGCLLPSSAAGCSFKNQIN